MDPGYESRADSRCHAPQPAPRRIRRASVALPRLSAEHDLTPSVGVVTVAPVLRQPRYLPSGALAKGAIAWTVATLIACGCGPIEYFNQVGAKAASAVAAAKEAEADRYAPYEYTAAEAYLHKAREEAGYAQYQDSIEFGRRAEELAHRARAIAMSRMNQSNQSNQSNTSRISSPLMSSPAPVGVPSDVPAAPAVDPDEPRPEAPRKRPETE
jgi:hypothetical protein